MEQTIWKRVHNLFLSFVWEANSWPWYTRKFTAVQRKTLGFHNYIVCKETPRYCKKHSPLEEDRDFFEFQKVRASKLTHEPQQLEEELTKCQEGVTEERGVACAATRWFWNPPSTVDTTWSHREPLFIHCDITSYSEYYTELSIEKDLPIHLGTNTESSP